MYYNMYYTQDHRPHDDKLEAKLRARITREDVALSEFVRQAIAEKLVREPTVPQKPSAYELWQKHFTGWGSGETDRSKRVKEIVGAEIDGKHRRR